MKVLILESSGNKRGSSNLLAGRFAEGAEEGGHEVTVFDVIHSDIRPCLGCGHCGMSGACVQKDDYEKVLKQLVKGCDVIAFAMPVYYYNWPAQLKVVVDRFYSFTHELTNMHKKAVLISVAWDNTDSAFEIVRAYYHKVCDYMQFDNRGELYGKGCGTVSMTSGSAYPNLAYQMGKSL